MRHFIVSASAEVTSLELCPDFGTLYTHTLDMKIRSKLILNSVFELWE